MGACVGCLLGWPARADSIWNALASKHEMRELLRGGPLRQPDRFERLDGAAAIARFVDELLDGTFPAPVVFKPNRNALGNGVVFIERNPNGTWTLTMAYNPASDRLLAFPETEAALRALRNRGARVIATDAQANTARVLLPADAASARPLLRDALEAILDAADSWGEKRAIVETMMPVFRYQGRAYETRHFFQGNLTTRAFRLIRYDDAAKGEEGWYARLGSSGYFSNYTGRAEAYTLDATHLFDPLYEAFRIPAGRHEEFEQFVGRLVRDAFVHASTRLDAQGIRIEGEIRGQFDLMWLPPEPGGNGFPVPVSIETWFHRPPLPKGAPCERRLEHAA